MRYNLIIDGDIEQSVLDFHRRNIEAVIEKAFYSEDEGKTALTIRSNSPTKEEDSRLTRQLDQWQAIGRLAFYSPYWGKGETSPLT